MTFPKIPLPAAALGLLCLAMVLLPSLSGAPPSISPVIGALGNEFIRVDFIPALRAGKSSVQPRIQVKSSKGWITAPLDPSAESYQILSGSAGVRMSIAGFYPEWPTDAGKEKSRVVWNAGRGEEAIARSVTQVDERHLKILFHRTSAGSLEALWELPSGEKSIRNEKRNCPPFFTSASGVPRSGP